MRDDFLAPQSLQSPTDDDTAASRTYDTVRLRFPHERVARAVAADSSARMRCLGDEWEVEGEALVLDRATIAHALGRALTPAEEDAFTVSATPVVGARVDRLGERTYLTPVGRTGRFSLNLPRPMMRVLREEARARRITLAAIVAEAVEWYAASFGAADPEVVAPIRRPAGDRRHAVGHWDAPPPLHDPIGAPSPHTAVPHAHLPSPRTPFLSPAMWKKLGAKSR